MSISRKNYFGVPFNMTKFILEGKVIYDTATHSLYHLKQRRSQVTLATPASLCLLALLQNKDETVSLESLLSFAWTSRGINVSNNTIYQNISILRKALVNAGLSADIIKTVPKRGFVVMSDSFSAFTLPPLTENKKANNIIASQPITSDKKYLYTTRSLQQISAWVPFVIISLLGCFLAFFGGYFLTTYNQAYDSKYIYPEFQEIQSGNDCHLYRNKSTRDNSFFEDFIASHEVKCSTRRWVYFINYPPASPTFVLSCDFDILSPQKKDGILCSSDYYF